MCGDRWISILGLCQFLRICGLYILAVILIRGNKKQNRKRQKREANTIEHNRDKNKEQVNFVNKPNQHLILESRSNLIVGLFIL